MGNMNTLYFVLCVVFVADLSIFSTAQVCSIDCHTRVGQVSDTDINSVSEIECEEGELMTGCSSYSQMSSERSGDHMKPIGDGKRSCVAMNGRNGTGTRAYARCCKWPGMECEYFQGNRSSSPDDGGSIAFCPDKINCLDTYATGCSVRSPWKGLTGTKPIMPDRCIGYNELVNKGLWVTTACCSAPNLICKTKSGKSGSVAGDEAIIWCDDGWIITGCSVRNPNRPTHGAYIDDNDNCVAVSGADDKPVWAVAVCCKDTF